MTLKLQTFDIKNMKDYLNLYLKLDILLLADVFKNFRNKSINSFELDITATYMRN